ncbi:MAG: CAP domain-containing protein [Parcubacteria group bacterium]
MLKWLKHYFIPHRHNNHKPHLLHSKTTTFLIGLVLAIECVFLLTSFLIIPNSGFFAAIIPNILVSSANDSRTEYDLGKLEINDVLVQAAEMKANDMVTKGYFAHVSPEGKSPWYWLGQADYKYILAGENLAVNFVDSHDVHTAWMDSPSHKDNILNKTFTEIGIATAQGTYQGQDAIFVVQYFGKPAATRVAVVEDVEDIRPNLDQSASPEPAERVSVKTPKPIETNAVVIAGQTDKANNTPNIANKILSQPHRLVSGAFLFVTLGVLFALGTTIVVRIERHHAVPLLNGILVVLVIGSMVLVNEFLSTIQLAIL